MVSFSLVIPCYNESRNLPPLVERLRKTMYQDGVEVVLVDNGSTDDTHEVLSRLLHTETGRIRSVRVEVNQGYGYGILQGLAAAEGEILGWTHADLQTDPADSLEGLKFFNAAKDPTCLFVKGRRYGRPVADTLFTMGMSAFETALLKRPMWDINAQPTMFPRAFFEQWKSPPHDFALDLFAYYTALSAGYTIERFPVHFGKRLHGHSHWNINWQAKSKFIWRTLDYSFRMKKGIR